MTFNIDIPDSSLDVLTKKEKQVLFLIAACRTNKEIAKINDVSIRTIETHRAHIMRKLGAKNTASLVWVVIKDKLGLDMDTKPTQQLGNET